MTRGRYPMQNTENLEMRTFHCDLAYKVQEIHRSRCPCCSKPMVRSNNRRGKPDNRRDVRTVGHDKPVGYNGDPRNWVFICAACNKDQAARTFREWSRGLERAGDKRAAAVTALADIFDQHYKDTQYAKRLPFPAAAE